MLRRLEYRVALDVADRSSVLSLPHVVKHFNKHDYVVRERDEATHCCVMLSGFSMRHKIVAHGARQILAIQMAGDIVDLENSILGVADHSVQMITSGEIALIPRAEVKQLAMDRPKVGLAMWHDTLVDGSIFREWIANVGRRDARTRTAHLLCELALRMSMAGVGEQDSYELPITQAELADAVGMTPVHVNRTLRSLEREGLITRSTFRSIVIDDWIKLADAGDFDTNYLHLKEGQRAAA